MRSNGQDEGGLASDQTAWLGIRATAALRFGRYRKGRGIEAVIPTKAGQAPDPAFARAAYRERTVVERLITRLEQWRRVVTRDETRASNYLAKLTVAAIRLWL